jgi:hypothetical protein
VVFRLQSERLRRSEKDLKKILYGLPPPPTPNPITAEDGETEHDQHPSIVDLKYCKQHYSKRNSKNYLFSYLLYRLMMINEYSIKKNNRKANNILYLFIVVGVIPLLCILAIYYKTPDNPLLQIIATSTKGIPSITSSYNPLMTKVMDIYCKTAPFLAFILFITTFKTRKLTKQLDKKTLTKACILSPLFYTITIYLFYFRSFDLMTSGRARLMADNNINLFILYSMLYISIFSMAYAFFYFPIIAYKLFKERQ